MNQPFAMSMGFILNWLHDLPSAQFERRLTLRDTEGGQIINKGQQNIISTSHGSVNTFLQTISSIILPQRRNNHQLVPLHVRRSVRKLVTLLPGQNLETEHDQNLGMISMDEIFDSQFHRLLVCSMVNGLASLGDIPVESIIKYLGRSKNMKRQFLQFLQACSGHYAMAFAETLFRAAIEASENEVIMALLETRLVDVNMALWHQGDQSTPIRRTLNLLNPAGATIFLHAGANTTISRGRYGIKSLIGHVLSAWARDNNNSGSSEWLRLVETILNNICHLDLKDIISVISDITKYPHPRIFGSEILNHIFSACPLSMHADFFSNGCLQALPKVFQDKRATEIAHSMIAECEKAHCSRCMKKYGDSVDRGILEAAERGYYNLVHLLLPFRSLPLSDISCASIRSRNGILINHLMSTGPDINAVVTTRATRTTPFAEAIRARNSSLVHTFEQAGILDSLHDAIRSDIAIKATLDAKDVDYVRKLLTYASCFTFPSKYHPCAWNC